MSHYYTRDGLPTYTVIGANGKERSTTLADARKMQLLPSVTEILKVIAKEALTNWMVTQGIMAALTGTRMLGESDAEYIARINADSREQAKKAADEGSRIHDAIECSFKPGYNVPPEYALHVQAARAELARLWPQVTDWVSEASFGCALGYGGKVDLHSPSTGIVVDIKTKDGDFTETDSRGKPKKLLYDQNWQVGAYQKGLNLPVAEGGIVFVSRTHPGKAVAERIPAEDMADGCKVFCAALNLWKTIKGIETAF